MKKKNTQTGAKGETEERGAAKDATQPEREEAGTTETTKKQGKRGTIQQLAPINGEKEGKGNGPGP